MSIFPSWLDCKEGLRYISDHAIELTIDAKILQFSLESVSKIFKLEMNTKNFTLGKHDLDFTVVEKPFKWNSNNGTLVFTFTRIEC